MNKREQYGKTAIARKTISAPMKWLHNNNFLNNLGDSIDFGCGRGFDAEYFNMEKYDPYHHPITPTGKYDTVTCNYVLNVVEPEEVQSIIDQIKALLKPTGKAYISVRRDKEVYKRQHYVTLPFKLLTDNNKFAIYEV